MPHHGYHCTVAPCLRDASTTLLSGLATGPEGRGTFFGVAEATAAAAAGRFPDGGRGGVAGGARAECGAGARHRRSVSDKRRRGRKPIFNQNLPLPFPALRCSRYAVRPCANATNVWVHSALYISESEMEIKLVLPCLYGIFTSNHCFQPE